MAHGEDGKDTSPLNAPTTVRTAVESHSNPIEPAFLESPSHITVPRWVSLSGISLAARALADELIDGAMRVHGDMAPTLDRQYLAWTLGANRYDKMLPGALRELVDIGFLVIYSGSADRSGRRQPRKHAQTGQNVPDTYGLRMDPPDTYTGPRNRGEAYELFRHDRDDAYAATNKPGARVSIPRRSFERKVSAVTPTKGTAVTPAKGTDPKPAVQRRNPSEGYDRNPNEGYGDVFAVHARNPESGRPIDRGMEGTPTEFPPSRSIDQPRDAACAAASASVETLDKTRELVRRLPWRQKGHNLTAANAEKLAQMIATAIAEHGFTVEHAQTHALRKLTESKSVAGAASYVIKGFAADQLYEPLADDSDVLPLPDPEAKDHQAKPEPAKQGKPSLHSVPASVARPACEVCGADEGADLAVRMVEDPATGNVAKCACRAHVA